MTREAALTLATPALSEPVKQVVVPGAQALAWFEAGHLAQAADTAQAVGKAARRLGFSQHFFAVDYLRALAGLALERRELDAAEQFAEQALSISERRRPALRVPGPAGPGRDLGRPRAGPQRAGRRRDGPADPGRDRLGAAGPGR